MSGIWVEELLESGTNEEVFAAVVGDSLSLPPLSSLDSDA